MDGNTYILRNYVPVLKGEETVAFLYGVTVLKDLPKKISIDNIYNANADVYIMDAATGDFIMDTHHEELKSIQDYAARRTKNGITWEDAVDDMMSLRTGYVEYYSETTHEWMYMYYAPSDFNPWSIAVTVPKNMAFEELYSIREVCIVTAVFIAVTIILFYVWMRRNARRKTQEAVDRAVLEEKLHKAEAAERAKTTFLSNMSHDIRTPMNAILGFTVLAQANVDDREKVQKYLSKILSSGNHLLSLINDVLDMSRIESGRLNIEEKPCSISDIFRDMRNIIQTQMHAKQLNFFMDTMDVSDEEIYCDKLHINQVLLNLLSNAIKFTPSGGSVSLMIRQKPGAPKGYGAYEIRVKDTGLGMSEDFVEHIFEPFEREKNSTVSGIQGTGLGMAITKSIVDTMGGSIQVNTQQGKGTEFVINFEFRLQEKVRPAETIQELQGMRALVVDDSFATCDSVTKMLVHIGMRAEWSLHGHEAVLRAKQAVELGDEFYAYIIDWALPDLGGLEVVRQIRTIVGGTVPIIIVTAYDWSEIEDEAREAGVTAFCNKPIFLSELRDVLAEAVGKISRDHGEDNRIRIEETICGARLLVVEDNELNREISQELFEENGFEVETAENGAQAVEMVKGSEPGYYSMIFMDIQMPVMNGYDATRAIRALENPALASIPIVAMTANAFEEDKRKAMDSGMNGHIAKPIDVDKILKLTSELLSGGKRNLDK